METSENRDVSIRVLRQKTRTLISELLNPQMYIRTEKGIHRYWLGLLGLCEIDPMYTASIEASPDPTGKILNLWCERDPQGSTIEKFVSFLDEMDRTDVIDDIADLIGQSTSPPCPRLFRCFADEDVRIYRANPESIKPPSLEADQYVMTTDDVLRINEGRPLEMYDAFVLYDQDDIDFAIQLLETMEKDYEMKFCVKDRDLVGGGLEMDKMIKLITERCNRLIVILSDSFFKSSANSYYLSFAQAYGIGDPPTSFLSFPRFA
jgi:myeloid differentiation primary response protein MyD88